MSKRTCTKEGCTRSVLARGLCNLHYGQLWKLGELPPREPQPGIHHLSNLDKLTNVADCAICGPGVPVVAQVRPRRDCTDHRCRTKFEQGRAAEALRRKQRPRSRANPVVRRKTKLKKKYNLTPADYERMVAAQGGRCGICRTPRDDLFIDHCHVTGAVRALLCHSCNIALAWLKDDPYIAQRAADYLSKHQAPSLRDKQDAA